MAETIVWGRMASARPANTDEAALLLAGANVEYNGVLRVCNQDSSARTFRIAHCAATGAAAGDEWLAYDKEILANDTLEFSIHLGNNEEVRIRASVGDLLTFHFSGEQKTLT